MPMLRSTPHHHPTRPVFMGLLIDPLQSSPGDPSCLRPVWPVTSERLRPGPCPSPITLAPMAPSTVSSQWSSLLWSSPPVTPRLLNPPQPTAGSPRALSMSRVSEDLMITAPSMTPINWLQSKCKNCCSAQLLVPLPSLPQPLVPRAMTTTTLLPISDPPATRHLKNMYHLRLTSTPSSMPRPGEA